MYSNVVNKGDWSWRDRRVLILVMAIGFPIIRTKLSPSGGKEAMHYIKVV